MEIRIYDDMSRCTEAEVERLLQVIPAWRAEEARRYKYLLGQYCCAKSWEMLMEIDRRFDCTIAELHKNESGKPYLKGGPKFSISHCKNAIAVVVADEEVGIDIEATDRKISRSLVEYTMNEEERKGEFIALWTRKEALLKKRGTGITGDMKEVLKNVREEITTHKEIKKGYIWSVCYPTNNKKICGGEI